jgi:glyoxylase-like metal-dependent hydrolase (beta-lactamase superfamily II)
MADLHPVSTDSSGSPAHEGVLGFHPVAAGVSRLRTIFVNLYAVETGDGGFVLIDTGMIGTAVFVKRAIAEKFGPEAAPKAIILTHAHIDHVGNARALSELYDIPVYVHPREKAYVNGTSDYPPADPTMGGAFAFFARAIPTKGVDLGKTAKLLPKDGSVPFLEDWSWISTPGHSAGHVSYFRESDGVLIAGDAFLTADMDNWLSVNVWRRRLSPPPTPLTPDWEAARASIFALSDLEPTVVATGHGKPISGDDLGDRLRDLANETIAPAGSRYSGRPALYKRDGSVASVPPPRPDPLPKKLIVAAVVVLVGAFVMKRRRN